MFHHRCFMFHKLPKYASDFCNNPSNFSCQNDMTSFKRISDGRRNLNVFEYETQKLMYNKVLCAMCEAMCLIIEHRKTCHNRLCMMHFSLVEK